MKTFLDQFAIDAYARQVTSYLEYFREIRRAKDRGYCQLLLDFLELFISSFSSNELSFR